MNQPLYIQAATAISPQHTYDRAQFLNPVMSGNNGKLNVIPADYANHISPVAIRRMSRAMKMAISAGMQCLQDAATTTPDAIITGTGRGSVTDMETLVKDMIRLDEEALNPTLFIQSTYNSPNGWLAMQSKCNGYNQTYVHRGSSLELALLDAQLLVAEGEANTVLLGSYDEMTDEHFIIKEKIGYWKAPLPESTLGLFAQQDSNGSIGGEGAAFFVLSKDQRHASTKIAALRILQKTNANAIREAIKDLLIANKVAVADVDFVLTGMSGDARYQPLYAFLDDFDSVHTGIGVYKHLSGEYDTASGFGLWLGDHLISSQQVPDEVLFSASVKPAKLNTILLVNHYIHGSASVILLQRAF